ncbi:hypothetical protein DSECCO2_439250 [anaerobic digester metagenome]
MNNCPGSNIDKYEFPVTKATVKHDAIVDTIIPEVDFTFFIIDSRTTSSIPVALIIPAKPIAQKTKIVVPAIDSAPPLLRSVRTAFGTSPSKPVIVTLKPLINARNPFLRVNPCDTIPMTTAVNALPSIVGIVGHLSNEPAIISATGINKNIFQWNI